ncbi:F-box domain-containing protein [Favolaschia claudopus]|uniref:F-box domain-containing protein n=1 Tax=Favolaschia claudopus TaxID=2862362 RepID=A0AAW0AYD2_9AGAR
MLRSLAVDRALLEDLDGQISELERSLAVLRQQKSAVKERLGAYKYYPVLSLPDENDLRNLYPIPARLSRVSTLRSPTILTQICRRWREVALSTPALWRALSLSDGLGQQLGDLWLDRAGSCPLSLKVDEFYDGNRPEELAAVLSYLGRCECLQLRLYASRTQLSTIQGAISEETMPLLRHLDLEFDHDEDLVEELYSDCVSMLLKTPNLTSFRLDEFSVDQPPDWHPPDVPLPHLQSFLVSSMKSSVGRSDCLATFLTPAIRKLHIPEVILGSQPIHALTSFVSRSGQLEHVHITGERLASDHSYRINKAFSFLKSLTFEEPYVPSKHIRLQESFEDE